jgi:tetratricopeptide (TPR) repeat protein
MMPTVYNGIGTWYYGRQRILRRKATCEFCKRLGELESFDTTLYFVVFFVPLLPLSRKRVLNQCPSCKRHRVTSLRQWEAAKAADIARLLEKLQANPDNRDTIREGLYLASTYQDPVLLDKLADTLARDRTDDAAIQAQLGAAYAFFARHAEAEQAFRASLAVQDDPGIRQQLAHVLLKQERPREAEPYLQHILDNKIAAEAGMLTLLVEGYQAEGMHPEALDFMDRRDAVFPDVAAGKIWTKQRQTSERYRDSGTKVRSVYLGESPRAGYREGGWAAKVPRLIAPVLLLGALAWYLGTALWLGQERQVYLVNGSDGPYTVAVNGREYRLTPGAVTPIRVREGEVTVALRDGNPPPEPLRGRVETPFLSRPFAQHTFVINPDRVAVLLREETEYADNPGGNVPPPQLYLDQAFYSFDGIDYEFAPFPASLQVDQGSRLRKTRVGLVPDLTPEARLMVANQKLDPARQQEYAHHLLERNPNDGLALAYLLSLLSPDDGLALLRTRLGERPVLVEWHRAYQTLMEKTHPEEDLRPTYRQLVQETGQQPDALYLLARVSDEDPDETGRLLRRAADANPPSAYALHGLGYQALEQGRFDEAVRWTTRAAELAPGNLTIRKGREMALLAAGQYGPLLEQLRRQEQQPGRRVSARLFEIQVCGLMGNEDRARALMGEVLGLASGPQTPASRNEMEANLEARFACGRHDTAGYLKAAARVPGQYEFEQALLRGQLREAAGHVDKDPDLALVQHALVYLAAVKAKEGGLADEQWAAVLTDLGRRHGALHEVGEVLAGRRPLQIDRLRRSAILPEMKRALLAVVARRRPETAPDLLPLARKLDFQADSLSLGLRKVLE